MTDIRYPIGKFALDGAITPAQVEQWLGEIEVMPAVLRQVVASMSQEQLDTPYREGGWTVRQVVHHLADAHLNNYVRVKLALTEEAPIPKPWNQQAWGELSEALTSPIDLSLQILDGVHARWLLTLRSLTPAQWARGFAHPTRGLVTLDYDLALYAWHGKHHTAHITALQQRMGW